jgi:geranylgeranyl diphosphate synthase type II
MISLKNAQEIIAQAIAKLPLENEPGELYAPMRYILDLGGKRIRPSLTLLACNVFSENIDASINAAVGLEIFHNFTLVHDDIMDYAAVRRGQPTIHQKWNPNIALLSGDGMCIAAYTELSKTPAPYLKPVLDVFNKTSMEVCEGQQYDMNFEKIEKVAEEDYLKMIALKTSVLLAACMKIGAITGGAVQEDADKMYQFGINMGLAFQLQDDLLDVFGDEATFGKEIGKDIVSNKKTFLLIKALENANSSQLAELRKWIQIKDFDREEKIQAITSLYNQLNIKEITQKKIDLYFETALKNLNEVKASEERKLVLKDFLEGLSKRKF